MLYAQACTAIEGLGGGGGGGGNICGEVQRRAAAAKQLPPSTATDKMDING